MVLEEGLDTSTLPDTLKEEFDQLNRFEGEYMVTSIKAEIVGFEILSGKTGQPCEWCNAKEKEEEKKFMVKLLRPMTTLSKVILILMKT